MIEFAGEGVSRGCVRMKESEERGRTVEVVRPLRIVFLARHVPHYTFSSASLSQYLAQRQRHVRRYASNANNCCRTSSNSVYAGVSPKYSSQSISPSLCPAPSSPLARGGGMPRSARVRGTYTSSRSSDAWLLWCRWCPYFQLKYGVQSRLCSVCPRPRGCQLRLCYTEGKGDLRSR